MTRVFNGEGSRDVCDACEKPLPEPPELPYAFGARALNGQIAFRHDLCSLACARDLIADLIEKENT